MNLLKQRSFRFKWRAVIGIFLFAILPLAFYVCVMLPVRETRAVVHAYNSLEMGTPTESLLHHFPREPDLVCAFDQIQVLYYHADPRTHYIPNFGDNQKKKILELKQRSTVQLDDLPYIYGYVQIVVDLNTKSVVAKTWNGETYHTHTILGNFRGSELSKLPEEARNTLHLSGSETGVVE